MASAKVGDRVGAISHSQGDTFFLFGFGTYQGDEVPPKGQGGLAGMMGIPNPKIQLDDGKVVWGAECWWGPEAQIRKKIESGKVLSVNIEDSRAAATAPEVGDAAGPNEDDEDEDEDYGDEDDDYEDEDEDDGDCDDCPEDSTGFSPRSID